jgi:hypothetical protein
MRFACVANFALLVTFALGQTEPQTIFNAEEQKS